MVGSLDITPLRSLVAIADSGGFSRAASSLHLSQAAVSQHVRRLESSVGRALVERHGRGSRLTLDGERLLAQARRILAVHDEAMRGFGADASTEELVTIGSTEHAAARVLPALTAALEASTHGYRVHFRIERGARLRQRLAEGRLDLALLLRPEAPQAELLGDLELGWYAAAGWRRQAAPTPVPVVAFDSPCPLRDRALETLSTHGIPAVIATEAAQLAGVRAAVGAGLGVALLTTLGHPAEGLVTVPDLPRPAPLQLYSCSRPGLRRPLVELVTDTVRQLLDAEPSMSRTA